MDGHGRRKAVREGSIVTKISDIHSYSDGHKSH